jgi:hypothetical protein
MITAIITIVAGEDCDADDADPIVNALEQEGALIPFADGEVTRPALEVEGIEIQVLECDYEAVCERFEAAGFEIIGGPDS